jgi:CheY-like chemotaxis protein
VHIQTRLAPDVWPALVDPTQLELAVLNLSINARDAMQVGGTLEVCTANVTLGAPRFPEEPAAGHYVEICVRDNGSGMPPEVREKVFEPFFTTKEIGKGSGLGLSQVLGFAKQSGGGLRLDSQPGKGTAVHIFLPRAETKAVAAESTPAPEKVEVANGGRILVVDDDNAVREVTAALLRALGYDVREAGSGGGALEVLESDTGFDLMVIDFAMPGMSGAELARHVRGKQPTLPMIFVTGFADRKAMAGVHDGHIVSKPFINGELADKVRLALAHALP